MHLSQLLSYGCTRLEIGVQSIYEDIARDTNRGHTVRSVCEAFCASKDAGYKIVAHMMPDLPNSPWERDMEGFREFFENPAFRADGLKIYPTLVIRGTGLYELWRTGRYKNLSPDRLVDLVAKVSAMRTTWDGCDARVLLTLYVAFFFFSSSFLLWFHHGLACIVFSVIFPCLL